MEPSVYWDGASWRAQIDLGPDRGGHRVRKTRHLDAATEEEAKEEAQAWADGIETSPLLVPALEEYVDRMEAMRAPKNTIRNYRSFIRSYVAPWAGSMRVDDVTPKDLSDLYASLMTEGNKDGGQLSGTTVYTVAAFLRGAWRRFVSDGYATSNPTSQVPSPRRETAEARALLPAELDVLRPVLVMEAQGEPSGRMRAARLALLALYTGMRCGECCAVRCLDVVPVPPHVHVAGTVTTDHGHSARQPFTKGKKARNVSLDDGAMDMARRMAADTAAMEGYRPSWPLVPTDEHGGWCSPSVVAHEFRGLCDEAGIDRVKFHSLRHTHASLLLAAGVDVKTVSERLGHSSPTTTLRIYAHVMPGRDADAAQIAARALGGLKANGT